MTRKGHLRLFTAATLVWAGFLALGLPDYYQQYPTAIMVWFDVLLVLPIAAVVRTVLRRVKAHRRMTVALWMAFYFTAPLAVYDWLYCGVVLGHGAAFLWRYWYLSVYYVIPWILFPAVALAVNRGERRPG